MISSTSAAPNGQGKVAQDFIRGSFGAAVVCRQTGRRYHGADTDEGCVRIGRKRVEEQAAGC